MRTILCYGDSNTWGTEPGTGLRYPREVRWPGVLRTDLGREYEVIEEGLGGRTTVWDDPLADFKNGKSYLIPCLDSHQPLDLVIIMLGTNDVQGRFSASAQEIAWGMDVLARIARRYAQVLIVSPPVVAHVPGEDDVYRGAIGKSRELGRLYAEVADDAGCAFLNAALVATSSAIDGIHFDQAEHAKLGRAVAQTVRSIFE